MPEFAQSSTKTAPILLTAVCLAGAAALIYFAHSAAIQSAPAYSTLNTSPDGAKLLFDGLNEAGFVHVSRQFKSVALQKPQNSTVFFLGIEPFILIFAERSYFQEMENSAAAGNRLVIAVKDSQIEPLGTGAKQPELADRWGIRFTPNGDTHTSSIAVDKNWKPLPGYGQDVWLRNFGKGSIILVGQTQRLSNKEVAGNDASRHLLQMLAGEYSSAVFEEAHLGIIETGSIAGLARHYRLQGLIAGLLLLAALFVWSQSVSFPPTPPIEEKTLLGSDTRSMLTELMSRHLKGQLIATCVVEWNRTRAHMPALKLPEESNAVAAYTQLQESLQKKTKFTI